MLLPTRHLPAQQGQGPTRPTRVSVTLAVVDSARTGDAPYRLLRRVDISPHDVILLRAGADAVVLSEAVGNLLLIRAQTGDTATVSGAVRVRNGAEGPNRQRRVLPWAGRVLSDLRQARPREVEGVGMVPTVEIWLPPQRGRRP
jgi:hypothetical protein